jgi:serine/threonine protein kinase
MFEYVKNGTLSRLIRKLNKIPLALSKLYAAEIVKTLEYLHQNGIIHRDLKPENILITSDYHIKIVSFHLYH